MRSKWRRWLVRVLSALAAIVFLPPLVSELLRRNPSPSPLPAPPPGNYQVCVADWGYHSSIYLQQPPNWTLGVPGDEKPKFVEYAWGARRYYMNGDHSLHSLLITLFLLPEPAAYVETHDAPPEQARGSWCREVNESQLLRLASELEGQMRFEGDGVRHIYPAAKHYTGRFYHAAGRYIWTYDCNRWSIERLHRAGLARYSFGVIHSKQVAGRLIGFHRAS